MSDVFSWFETLRRPALLVQAAKLGLPDYNRNKVLKRVSALSSTATPTGAIRALIPVEESLEDARLAGDASYTPSRHVEVLIALLAELRSINPRMV